MRNTFAVRTMRLYFDKSCASVYPMLALTRSATLYPSVPSKQTVLQFLPM